MEELLKCSRAYCLHAKVTWRKMQWVEASGANAQGYVRLACVIELYATYVANTKLEFYFRRT